MAKIVTKGQAKNPAAKGPTKGGKDLKQANGGAAKIAPAAKRSISKLDKAPIVKKGPKAASFGVATNGVKASDVKRMRSAHGLGMPKAVGGSFKKLIGQ